MRRSFAVVLVLALVRLGVPAPVSAMQAPHNSIAGKAVEGGGKPLSGTPVRLRNTATSLSPYKTTTDANGDFVFKVVADGQYVVEIVHASGKVLGVSKPVAVSGGQAVTGVQVVATVAAPLPTIDRGSFLKASAGLIAAAIAAGIVVGFRQVGQKSPSK